MSFGITAIIGGAALAGGATIGTAAAIGLGASYVYNTNQAQKKANELQKQQMDISIKAAEKQQQQQEQAFNKANAKTPDLSAIMANAQQRGGPSGTMLTGPSGIDPSALNLSKNTLLGM